MKIGPKRINTQKGITVEVLLDNEMIGLVISSEFIRKQVFKLKKMERLIYVDGIFNKKEPITGSKHIL